MKPYYEFPNLGGSFRQTHADRAERPGRQIDGTPSFAEIHGESISSTGEKPA